MNLRRAAARWRSRARELESRWTIQREAWRLELELERAVTGPGPIVAGPWLSEVGHELLYWIPFLRWVQAAYRVPAHRWVAVSRGGVASWYEGLAGRYVEVFDLIEPGEFAAAQAVRLAEGGTGKQVRPGRLDDLVLEAVRREVGGGRVLHPSVMYRLFAQFWSGQQPVRFVEQRTRHARLHVESGPGAPLPDLPARYVAVKCHASRALPDVPATRRLVQRVVAATAARLPVVLLETGLRLDEHADFALDDLPGVISLRGRLEARSNLGVQTGIVAGAEAFLGTCGGLAWAAPSLGIDTTALVGDPRLLHAHLSLARRVYHRVDGGRFATLDLGGLERLGVDVVPAGVGA